MVSKRLLGVFLGLSLPLTAQVTVFEGPAGAAGSIRSVDPAGGTQVLLEGVRLLPIDVCGRTLLDALRGDRPQLRSDVPQASRVVLPDGGGSLYRYERAQNGLLRYGLLHVEAQGRVRALAELPGTGPAGTIDPCLPALAVDPSGQTVWLTSTVAAGGNLLELDLGTGELRDRTEAISALDFLPYGTALFQDFGVAMTQVGPLRLDRGLGPPHLVTVAQGPTWFGPDVVSSEDGSTFAFLAGPSAQQTHVYFGRRTGQAVPVSETPTGLTSAGLLPGADFGPWVALSTDGSTCAWIADDATREVYVRTLDPTLVMPAQVSQEHVTGDARFTSTLNESGVIAFFSPISFAVLVGDDSGSRVAKIESGDIYRVDVTADAGGPTPIGLGLTNLSLTSGDGQVPFLLEGSLSTEGGLCRLPGLDGLLIYDDVAGGEVKIVTWDGDVSTLVGGVEQLNNAFVFGDDLLLDVQHEDETTEALSTALYRYQRTTGTVTQLVELAGAGIFNISTANDRTYAAIAKVRPGLEWGGRIDFPEAVTRLFYDEPLTYGPTIGFAPDGAFVLTVMAGADAYHVLWGDDGSLRLAPGSGQPGFYLPAR